MSTLIQDRLLALLNYLNHGLVEREGTLKAALLAVLAGENLLLVGPPGTAKSLIARNVSQCLAHDGGGEQAGKYFEYLLTKFSTPEEIFGPLSISELKADRFKRNTAGYLPSVRMAFLDEIFKASSSILNALLTILNERLYHNGAEAQDIPLLSLIAASNELPTGQEELDALYDRFLVRSFVDYVSAGNLPRLLDKPGSRPEIIALSNPELTAIRQAADTVDLPADIVSAIQKIWAGHKQLFKEDRRENLSDRRLKKAVGLLRISAASNGRQVVDLSDLFLLKDCLWNHPDNALKVRELVMSILRVFSYPVPVLGPEIERATPRHNIVPQSGGEIGVIVKGYKGSGTEQDPILIENLHDLAGLERSEVGQQGYWFRQTADIDCSELTTWLKIDFQGVYDGCGHMIEHQKSKSACLFERVQDKSRLGNIRLTGLSLVKDIAGSGISNCASNRQLLRNANDCTISCCESGSSFMDSAGKCVISHCLSGSMLVVDDVNETTITRCRSRHVLIGGEARASTIDNCEVRVSGRWNFSTSGILTGGVAMSLHDSTVERSIVTGSPATGYSVKFSCIAWQSKASMIRQCAFGAFNFQQEVSLNAGRIVNNMDAASKLENNVALDCHKGESDPGGINGKSLSAALFTQHYFEHTLDWDFKDIWQWNNTENQPELRAVGTDAMRYSGLHGLSGEMGDMLTQQLTANIWV